MREGLWAARLVLGHCCRLERRGRGMGGKPGAIHCRYRTMPAVARMCRVKGKGVDEVMAVRSPPVVIASSSSVPRLPPCRVKGKAVDEVLTIKNSDIAKHLSQPPVKRHCSMLAEDAIKVRLFACFSALSAVFSALSAVSVRRLG